MEVTSITSMETSTAPGEAFITSMKALVETFVEAPLHGNFHIFHIFNGSYGGSYESFRGSYSHEGFHYFLKSSMEGFVEVTSMEASLDDFVKAPVDVRSVQAFSS